MRLPDIWGQGALFAFSGMDGECRVYSCLNAHLLGDLLGVRIHARELFDLYVVLDGIKDIQYEAVASDVIKARLKDAQGMETPFLLTFLDQQTIVGLCGRGRVQLRSLRAINETRTEHGSVFVCGTSAFHFWRRDEGELTLFSFSLGDFTPVTREKVEALCAGRIAFFERFGPLCPKDEALALTFLKCISVMKSQVYTADGQFRQRWTTPNRLPHRWLWLWDSAFHSLGNFLLEHEQHVFRVSAGGNKNADGLGSVPGGLRQQLLGFFHVLLAEVFAAGGGVPGWLWLWDSAFHSLGNFLLDETLPRDTLLSVLDVQREDGFIPHLARPSFTSDITQPPLLAWAAVKLYERTGDADFLRDIKNKLQKYLEWNIRNRRDPESGLFCWHVNTTSENCRADESGMDNSPRFDNVSVMECIDFSCFMLNEASAMARIDEVTGECSDRDWQKYASELKQAINGRLWDEEDGFYYDRVPGGDFHKVKSVASFLPLFCGAATEDNARVLSEKLKDASSFDTYLPLPSISRSDPSFDADMWRGAVWLNCNYMICEGLKKYGFTQQADGIIKKTVREVALYYLRDGVIYEMYDPDGRVSPRCIRRKGRPIEPYDPRVRYQAIRDYGWTSALYCAMISENKALFM